MLIDKERAKEYDEINYLLREYSAYVRKFDLIQINDEYLSYHSSLRIPSDEILAEIKCLEISILNTLNYRSSNAYSTKSFLEYFYKNYCAFPVTLGIIFRRSEADIELNEELPPIYYSVANGYSTFHKENEYNSSTVASFDLIEKQNGRSLIKDETIIQKLNEYTWTKFGLEFWTIALIVLVVVSLVVGFFRGES